MVEALGDSRNQSVTLEEKFSALRVTSLQSPGMQSEVSQCVNARFLTSLLVQKNCRLEELRCLELKLLICWQQRRTPFPCRDNVEDDFLLKSNGV